MPDRGWIVVGVAAAAVLVAVIVLGLRLGRTRRLRRVFGSEYERTVREAGSRSEAEAELRGRRRRHGRLDLRPLEPEAPRGYLERWQAMQERFVDDPQGATVEADNLVLSVMRARGYPVEDIEQRAADISVDYPGVVASYRAAHEVAVRQSVGEATTGDLRNAMRHYRALFDELLGTNAVERLRAR